MSTTLSARYVRRPRARYLCDGCCRPIDGPYIRLYGMADRPPAMTLRLHPTDRCCPNVGGDTKIAAALAAAAPDLAMGAPIAENSESAGGIATPDERIRT